MQSDFAKARGVCHLPFRQSAACVFSPLRPRHLPAAACGIIRLFVSTDDHVRSSIQRHNGLRHRIELKVHGA